MYNKLKTAESLLLAGSLRPRDPETHRPRDPGYSTSLSYPENRALIRAKVML